MLSYTASLGSSGDILPPISANLHREYPCRIDIAIMNRATSWTGPRTDSKRHFGNHISTIITNFRRRKESISFHYDLTLSLSFVREECDKRRPAAITNSFCKASVLHHSTDMQIFNSNDLVFVHQPSRNFVQKIGSCAVNLIVGTRYKHLCFVIVGRTFFLSREQLLFALQIAFGTRQKTSIGYLLACAGYSEVSQADINTYSLPIGGRLRTERASSVE